MNQLDALKKWTTVVADTGDFESMRSFKPTDATTNPSLILSASQKKEYRPLIEQALVEAGKNDTLLMDLLFVKFGLEILKIVPGRVSTEIDASLSFDAEKSYLRAKHIISLYEKANISRERILVKLASTWEGVQAAKRLEKEGIHCNMTLLFALPQAIACAEAGATLISPFVGRILDWYKAKHPDKEYSGSDDPGVLSVKEIYTYYKSRGFPTQIMGASFRNKEEICALAGLDLLTISPSLLAQLEASKEPLERVLSTEAIAQATKNAPLDEATFRFQLNQSAMGTEKLAEGIRKFAEDYEKLLKTIRHL